MQLTPTGDVLLAMRRKTEVLTAVFFFVVVASLFPLGIGPEVKLLRLIAPGMSFDAFVVDCEQRPGGLDYWEGIDDEERLFEKIVRLAGPADITDVWVAGRRVAGD